VVHICNPSTPEVEAEDTGMLSCICICICHLGRSQATLRVQIGVGKRWGGSLGRVRVAGRNHRSSWTFVPRALGSYDGS
jgi:hypothetical protein